MPTYKRAIQYLLRAINSIKAQTYKHIEIVIVDDNPPDSKYRKNVIEFMKKYNDDSSVIYVMNAKNLGGSLARNNGINVATGDFITFLDDDDEYLPEKIEKQVMFMLEHNCDMSFTDLKLVNNNKVVVDYREYSSLKKFDQMSLLKYHLMRHLTGTPTFMYKTEKLKQIGGFEDVKIGQEFFLMLKSIENNLKICYLKDCNVIAYRHSDGGISQGKSKINGEMAIYDFKKKYFHLFTQREKMFIRFRYHAVMMIAYKRNKNYLKALFNGILMIVSSPVDFIKEFSRFIFNIIKNRGLENETV